MNLKETGKAAPNVETSTIGTIAHRTLAQLYNEKFVATGGMVDWDIPGIEERLDELIDEHFRREFSEMRGEIFILKELLRMRLKRFLENERRETQSMVYRIIGVEKKFTAKLDISDELSVELEGWMDRIDQDIHSGTFRIIDYKIGNPKQPSYPREISSLFEERPDREKIKKVVKSVQLPLYLYLFSRNTGISWERLNAGLYRIKEARLQYLFPSSFEPSEKSELMERFFIPSLRYIISEMFDSETVISPDESDERYCRVCPYRHICANRVRLDELKGDA